MSGSQPPRLGPLAEAAWDPALGSILDGLNPVLNVHRVMAHHPDLLAAWTPLRNHIALGGTLLPRHREIVMLRVAHLAGSEYEWHHHVRRGRLAGLGDDEIEAIRLESVDGWDEAEANLLVATAELFHARSLTDPTWRGLAREFSHEQILDLIVTVGVYVTLSMLIAATGVQIEV